MGGRSEGPARQVGTACLHGLRAFLVNPQVVAVAAMLLGMALLFTDVMGLGALFNYLVLGQMGACALPAIALSTLLAEERGTGALGTLERSGISFARLAAGRVVAAVLVSEAFLWLLGLAVLRDALAALAGAALMALATVPVALTTAGLCADVNEQGRAAARATPFVLLALVTGAGPLLRAASRVTIELPLWLLPAGSAPELAGDLLLGYEAMAGIVPIAAAGLMWCAVAAAFCIGRVRTAPSATPDR